MECAVVGLVYEFDEKSYCEGECITKVLFKFLTPCSRMRVRVMTGKILHFL